MLAMLHPPVKGETGKPTVDHPKSCDEVGIGPVRPTTISGLVGEDVRPSMVFAAITSQSVAQTGVARVSVPFQFTIANKTLPAGDYSIAVNNSLLQVAAIDGKNSACAMTVYFGGASNDNMSTRLVFHRYGERYFLAQVWLGKLTWGTMFASPQEVEYARTNNQENVTVAVVSSSK